jgi:hypothetical protein
MKNEPSLKEWRTLYEAAIRVKKIAPWDWMDETDIFGVQNGKTVFWRYRRSRYKSLLAWSQRIWKS